MFVLVYVLDLDFVEIVLFGDFVVDVSVFFCKKLLTSINYHCVREHLHTLFYNSKHCFIPL